MNDVIKQMLDEIGVAENVFKHGDRKIAGDHNHNRLKRMYFDEGKSTKEIADIFGCSISSAKRALSLLEGYGEAERTRPSSRRQKYGGNIVTNDAFKTRMTALYGDEYAFSEYTNSYELITVTCNKHNYTFNETLWELEQGQCCPICKKEKRRSTLLMTSPTPKNFLRFNRQFGFDILTAWTSHFVHKKALRWIATDLGISTYKLKQAFTTVYPNFTAATCRPTYDVNEAYRLWKHERWGLVRIAKFFGIANNLGLTFKRLFPDEYDILSAERTRNNVGKTSPHRKVDPERAWTLYKDSNMSLDEVAAFFNATTNAAQCALKQHPEYADLAKERQRHRVGKAGPNRCASPEDLWHQYFNLKMSTVELGVKYHRLPGSIGRILERAYGDEYRKIAAERMDRRRHHAKQERME